jgi:hypothetical protein
MLVFLFYHIDEFCKILHSVRLKNSKLPNRSALTTAEIMTISVYFHYSGYKTFKDYYIKEVLGRMKSDFKLVSYNRFVELKQEIALDLGLFAQLLCRMNQCTGTSFIDSFSMPVSHNKRINSHKVFKGFAARGKTSVGWFFGFKMHIVIDPMGNILNFHFTPGNVSDANKNVINALTSDLYGKLFGDKGYLLDQKLFRKLYNNGIKMVTKVRKNMQNKLLDFEEKMILTKRGIVESVIDILKIHLSIDHTRHRSQKAFIANAFSGLIAYAFYPKKPSIALNFHQIA